MNYPGDFINKIICGDCLEVMKDIPDNSVDLVVTSPPYDDLRNYNGYKLNVEDTSNELFRIVKWGGVVVWIVGDKIKNRGETGTSFRHALIFKNVGFNLHDTMIYHKTSSSLPDRTRYSQMFEYMFVFSKGKIHTFNPIVDKPNKQAGSTNPTKKRDVNGNMIKTDKYYTIPPIGKRGNIWTYEVGCNKGTKDKIAFKHPATFPDKLAEDHILSWSNINDIILDPMCGSGTTCKMAKKNNRKFIGVDISQEYVDIANQRLSG
jgi:DNA modification methylase